MLFKLIKSTIKIIRNKKIFKLHTLILSIVQGLNVFKIALLFQQFQPTRYKKLLSFILNSKREKTSYTQEPTHSNRFNTGEVSSIGTTVKLGGILVDGVITA